MKFINFFIETNIFYRGVVHPKKILVHPKKNPKKNPKIFFYFIPFLFIKSSYTQKNPEKNSKISGKKSEKIQKFRENPINKKKTFWEGSEQPLVFYQRESKLHFLNDCLDSNRDDH